MCEVPLDSALLPHRGLADAISPDQIFRAVIAARLLRSDGNARRNSNGDSKPVARNVSG
jgi:hypothetical protein